MCILITKQPWSLTKSSKTPMTIGLKRKSPPSFYFGGHTSLRFTSEGRAGLDRFALKSREGIKIPKLKFQIPMVLKDNLSFSACALVLVSSFITFWPTRQAHASG